MLGFMFKTKRRKTATISTIGLLLTAGIAVAAFVLYSGISGSGQAHLTSTTSQVGALTISGAADPELTPGTTTSAPFSVTNNDSSAAHQITALSASITSNPAGAGAYITLSTADLVGVNVAAGATSNPTLDYVVSSNIPISYAGATVSVSFTGTTSP